MRLFALGAFFLGAAVLTAAPVYRFCDPNVEDCEVIRITRIPTQAETASLTAELFSSFFASGNGEGEWYWSVFDSSAIGTLLGSVTGSGLDWVVFVFKDGGLVCCWFGDPLEFMLYDINDAGFIVGMIPQPFFILCTGVDCESGASFLFRFVEGEVSPGADLVDWLH